jgi:hypothetical protein
VIRELVTTQASHPRSQPTCVLCLLVDVCLQACYVWYNELYKCYAQKGKEDEQCAKIKKDVRCVGSRAAREPLPGGPACWSIVRARCILVLPAAPYLLPVTFGHAPAAPSAPMSGWQTGRSTARMAPGAQWSHHAAAWPEGRICCKLAWVLDAACSCLVQLCAPSAAALSQVGQVLSG